jgi:hypothetical protein
MVPGCLSRGGCGRGEFLKGFRDLGLDACGVDISEKAPASAPMFPSGCPISRGKAFLTMTIPST